MDKKVCLSLLRNKEHDNEIAFSIKPKKTDPIKLLQNQYKIVQLFSGNHNNTYSLKKVMRTT